MCVMFSNYSFSFYHPHFLPTMLICSCVFYNSFVPRMFISSSLPMFITLLSNFFYKLSLGICSFILLYCMRAKSLRLCQTLGEPMACSLPGSFVCGVLQARILEWVAMSFSRGSSQRRDRTHISNVFCIGRWVLYH